MTCDGALRVRLTLISEIAENWNSLVINGECDKGMLLWNNYSCIVSKCKSKKQF